MSTRGALGKSRIVLASTALEMLLPAIINKSKAVRNSREVEYSGKEKKDWRESGVSFGIQS